MQRSKTPKGKMTNKSKKKKLKFIIDSLSHGWLGEERETSILFDQSTKRVHFETSRPPTARRWFKTFWGMDEVKWDTKGNTLKFSLPKEYCRIPDLVIKPKYRN